MEIVNAPLVFADDLLPGIKSEDIRVTVRAGFRDYIPGECRAVSEDRSYSKPILIFGVEKTTARFADAFLLGYDNSQQFYEHMRKYGGPYEDFGPDTEITMIWFESSERLLRELCQDMDRLKDR